MAVQRPTVPVLKEYKPSHSPEFGEKEERLLFPSHPLGPLILALHRREQEAQRQGHGMNGFEEEKFGPEIRAGWLGSPLRVPCASQP